MALTFKDLKPGDFAGIAVYSNSLATVTRWRIEPHPTPKRRRRWRAARYQAPSAFMVDSAITRAWHPTAPQYVLHVHPDFDLTAMLEALR